MAVITCGLPWNYFSFRFSLSCNWPFYLIRAHLLPLFLNLLENRDFHVRVLLLHHIGSFVSLCNHDDLVGVVLPEVLVGLKDSSDEMVSVTLHALGELVPYVGAELVMGTSRKRIFMDAQPRVRVKGMGVAIAMGRDKWYFMHGVYVRRVL